MNVFGRLTKHYQTQPPRLSFGGSEGSAMEMRVFNEWPEPNARLVFGLFAALAEFERELIVERTNAGLAAARARGRMGGRPRKVDIATLKMAAAAMSDPKSIAYEVAKKLN